VSSLMENYRGISDVCLSVPCIVNRNGVEPPLPDWLADLAKRKERVTVLPADQVAVERFVASASRAAREGAAA